MHAMIAFSSLPRSPSLASSPVLSSDFIFANLSNRSLLIRCKNWFTIAVVSLSAFSFAPLCKLNASSSLLRSLMKPQCKRCLSAIIVGRCLEAIHTASMVLCKTTSFMATLWRSASWDHTSNSRPLYMIFPSSKVLLAYIVSKSKPPLSPPPSNQNSKLSVGTLV